MFKIQKKKIKVKIMLIIKNTHIPTHKYTHSF